MGIPAMAHQAENMYSIRHLTLAILIAVFAMGTAAYAAMATEITLAMSIADAAEIGADMPDCSGCDKDAKTDMAACDLACTAPLTADLNGAASIGPRVSSQHDPSVVVKLCGRTGPPALDPPRTHI